MCLRATKKSTDDFKKKHSGKDTIKVWKVYEKFGNALSSPVTNQKVFHSGIVKSDRCCKKMNNLHDYDRFSRWYIGEWLINHGIHVFLTRKVAEEWCRHNSNRVVVCCHARMSDLVATDTFDKAVFMKISISPRNYRRAITGK